MFKKYYKKADIIEAVQWTGDKELILEFCKDIVNHKNHSIEFIKNGNIIINSPGRYIEVIPQGWIAKDIKGAFYIMDDDYFKECYEELK